MSALTALEGFAAKLLSVGVSDQSQRQVVCLAWDTARLGTPSTEASDTEGGSLTAEEAAIAEMGAVAVAAALEAASCRAGRGSRAVNK